MISLRVKSYNRGTKKRSGCCRFTLLWGESHFFLSQHELKSSFLKTTVFSLPSQHYLSVKQYCYSMFTVLRCTVQKKSPTIYCTGLPFTCLLTANDLVPLGLSIYNPSYSNLYHTPESESPFSLKNQIMVVSVPVLTRKVNMGTFIPQTHCKRDSNFGYSFVVFFLSFCHYFSLQKKSKGQRTLTGEDLEFISIRVKSVATYIRP